MQNDRVLIREVLQSDLPIFFEHQHDPEACRVAVWPSRERDAFMAHWATILVDPTVIARAVQLGDELAGNVVSFNRDGRRMLGYWIGREFWGRGVASAGVAQFLVIERTRPLYAWIAATNLASVRVVEKAGFVVESKGRSTGPNGESVIELLMVLKG